VLTCLAQFAFAITIPSASSSICYAVIRIFPSRATDTIVSIFSIYIFTIGLNNGLAYEGFLGVCRHEISLISLE